jgi:hypothetical protein
MPKKGVFRGARRNARTIPISRACRIARYQNGVNVPELVFPSFVGYQLFALDPLMVTLTRWQASMDRASVRLCKVFSSTYLPTTPIVTDHEWHSLVQ